MAYEIKELDPVKELSPMRRNIEFGIVFLLTFCFVRFGGWHHGMDPLGYAVNSSSLTALIAAAIVSTIFIVWRVWYAGHSAVHPDSH
jgi:hypothetical protein